MNKHNIVTVHFNVSAPSGIPSVHKTRYLPNAFLVLYGFLIKTTSTTTTTTTKQQSPPPDSNNFDEEVARRGGWREKQPLQEQRNQRISSNFICPTNVANVWGSKLKKRNTSEVARRSKYAFKILEQNDETENNQSEAVEL